MGAPAATVIFSTVPALPPDQRLKRQRGSRVLPLVRPRPPLRMRRFALRNYQLSVAISFSYAKRRDEGPKVLLADFGHGKHGMLVFHSDFQIQLSQSQYWLFSSFSDLCKLPAVPYFNTTANSLPRCDACTCLRRSPRSVST